MTITLLFALYISIYLVMSYTTIYRFTFPITMYLRIVFAFVLMLFAGTILIGVTTTSWWIVVLVLALIINIEILAFKHKIHDNKAVKILNIFTALLSLMVVVTTAFVFHL